MNRFFFLLAMVTLILTFSMIPVDAKSNLHPRNDPESNDKPIRAHTLSAEARDRFPVHVSIVDPAFARDAANDIPLPKARLENDTEEDVNSSMGDIETQPHRPTRSEGLTNAERMKRGLPLKMPSRLYTPSRAGAIRPRAS